MKLSKVSHNIFMKYLRNNPNMAVFTILLCYNILGFTVLGFNRTPLQVLFTVVSCGFFQFILDYLYKKELRLSISALITGLGLSILLNYGQNYWITLIPVFFAIMMKYIFTFKGKHIFNPGLMGVALSFILTNELISPAPAYQWNGLGAMSLFIAGPAIFIFMPKINRHWLVGSFLATFIIQLIARSLIMKHYLPFNTLFLGTITSPSFFLFTFFMLTDPVTTPNGKKEQIIAGITIGLLDLFFHLFSSYHTFFYAALVLGTYKLFKNHINEMIRTKQLFSYFKNSFISSGYYKKPLLASFIAVFSIGFYQNVLIDSSKKIDPGFVLTKQDAAKTGIKFKITNNVLYRLDKRIHNISKWILSISDGVATGDFDNDGLQDIFFTNALKSDEDRNALYKNMGNFEFKRIIMPSISKISKDIERYGLPSNAGFIDFDNDGDLDLFISYAFGSQGSSRLFKNTLKENNKAHFVDITHESGLSYFTNSAAFNFVDLNNDGRLDLIIGNTIDTHLRDYNPPRKLNLFDLPKAEYEGDRRMLHFMHKSWHMADNGGLNYFFIQGKDSKFTKLSNKEIGLMETRWTMAISTADFNHDGLIDLYMANDFGPDKLYLNQGGMKFAGHEGKFFGSIGRDTYKGMNATIADFDRNGYQDVYISNVHHALQAEGSLLWSFSKSEDGFIPNIEERATYWGVLNENRFGWGAGVADFNNDGWVDLVQANGMVDDKVDKKDEKCSDYWYYNEKIARAPPSIHSYSDSWADIRGRCIYGKEKNRLYVNRGNDLRPKFLDVAGMIGLDQIGNYRGMSPTDFDNDGRVDLLVTSHYRQPLIFKNNNSNTKLKNANWIGIELENKELKSCSLGAYGSRVKISYKDHKGQIVNQFVETTVINGFSAQSDKRIVFGLGSSKAVKEIEVNWCLQIKKKYTNLEIGKYHKLNYSKIHKRISYK